MAGRRGSVLILTALVLVVAVAIAGEGYKLSRALLDRKQLDRIAEPAALGAVLELDGTAAGLERARVRAQGLAGREVTLEFGESESGPWAAAPPKPDRMGYVRVTASLEGYTRRVRAGQRPATEWSTGAAPFTAREGAAEIEYFGDPLPRAARLAVEQGLPSAFRLGDSVKAGELTGEAKLALDKRVQSDTDRESATYEEYVRKGKGNGRRLIPVVVRDSGDVARSIVACFLPPRLEDPARGECCGGYLQGGRFRAVADSGYAVAEVVR